MRDRIFGGIASIFLLFPAVCVAEVMMYQDESGVPHYVASEAQIPEKHRTKASLVSADMFSKSRSKKALQSKKVTIYVTEWCPYCRKLEAFLEKEKIKYIRKDIEKDSEAARQYRSLSGTGVPLVTIGKTVLKGFSPARILEELS